MEKKLVKIIGVLCLFFLLFFLGQLNGQSGLSGDVNLIDEGQYAAWVQHMLHGQVPYRDFFVQYSPLQIYPLYFLTKFFGPTIFLVRLWTGVIWTFLGVCVAIVVLHKLKVMRSVFLLTVVSAILLPGTSIRHWLGILCIVFVQETWQKKSKIRAFLLGVLLVVTNLFSIEVGIFTSFICIAYLVWQCIQKEVKVILLGTIAVGIIISLMVFVFVATSGGWFLQYLSATSTTIFAISGVQLPNGQGLPNIFENQLETFTPLALLRFILSKQMLFYWSLLIPIIVSSIVTIRFFLRKTSEQDGLIAMILCFTLFSYASIVGRSGHYPSLVVMIMVCFGYIVSLLSSLAKKDKVMHRIFVVTFCLFLLYATRHISIYRYTSSYNIPAMLAADRTVRRVAPLGISKEQARYIQDLQDYVRNNTKETDTVFFMNNLPGLYFLVDRANATEYDLPLLAYAQEQRISIVTSLSKNKPVFIIEDKNAWAVDGISDRERLPEVMSFIRSQYTPVKTLGSFIIYKKQFNIK